MVLGLIVIKELEKVGRNRGSGFRLLASGFEGGGRRRGGEGGGRAEEWVGDFGSMGLGFRV